ncbi:MAG: TonB-dependent receptor [Flavitalea sp.]
MRLKPLFKQLLFLTVFGLFCLHANKAHSQVNGSADKRVKGQVTDENGVGLQGVSVTLKGTSKGAITDSTGTFAVTVPAKNATLVFSFLNYSTEEVKVGASSNIDVHLTLDEKSKDLGEVVVVGYGTQKKVDLTGAVGSISRRDIGNRALISPDQALGGKISGVQISNRSADPGAPIEVRIRGVGTIGNNQPLWVIDGTPTVQTTNISVNTGSFTETNPLSGINPNDIESIDVLKDASAAAIYGARAANGVIIVTTKRGKEGKVVLTYDGYQGLQSVPNSLHTKVLNVDQYINLQSEIGNDLTAFKDKPFVNWQDLIFQTAVVTDHNLTVSGGAKNFNFNVGAGYHDQSGIERGQGFKRISFKANSDLKVGDHLKFGESILISHVKRLTQSEGGSFGASRSTTNAPYFAPYDPTDPTGYTPSNSTTRGSGASAVNYLWQTDSRYNQTLIPINSLLGSVYGELEIIKGLKYRIQAGVQYTISDGTYFQAGNDNDYGDGTTSSRLVQERPIELTTTVSNTLTYNKSFGKSDLTALIGEEETNFSYSKFRIQGEDLLSLDVRLASVANTVSAVNEADHWALRGLLGRLNYTYNDKYLLTINVRKDQTSRFSAAHRSGVFPSISAGWRVGNENFMKSAHFIRDLKIRASIGESGNQFTGSNFAYLSNLQTTIYYPIGANQVVSRGLAPVIFANPNLKWETSVQSDIGLDATLLNGKIDLTFDYFNKITKDVLLSYPLPYSSGYFLPSDVNLGKIKNSGIELSLAYRGQTGLFHYSIGGNITTVNNKIISLGNIPEIVGGIGGGQTNRTTVGQSLGYFYGYKTNGLYQNAGDVAKAIPDSYSSGTAPGDIRFVDVNGDGKVDASDKTIIGSPIPKYYYGFNLTGNYKKFDLSIFLQGVGKVSVYNAARQNLESMDGGNNQSTRVLSRWTGEGTSNNIPRATSSDLNGNNRFSDRWVEDASYFRVKNVQLGYTLSSDGLKRVTHDFISFARFYIGVSNLLTATSYLGYNPEVTRGSSYQKGEFPLANGQDSGGSPLPIIMQLGWQINF